MNSIENKDSEKWLVRLDAVKARYAIATDAELARFIDISKQRLQQLRAGSGKQIPFEVKFQIWNLEGMTDTTARIWELLPTEKAAIFMKRYDELSKRLRMQNSRML